MVKKTEIFEEFFFNELFQATERTLEKLAEEEGWKIENYEKEEVRKWTVQAIPRYSLFKFHFLPNGAYKKMTVEVSNHQISVQCVDNWPSLTFDFLNQKKKLINLFFSELKKVIKEEFGQ